MADDDDDWDTPIVASITQKVNLDDDELVMEQEKAKGPSEAIKQAQKLKAQREEIALQNKLKHALLEDETPEERRIREKQEQEMEGLDMANDLLGDNVFKSSRSSSATGFGGIQLQNKEDHKSFAILCTKKLESSTAMNLGQFFKTIVEKNVDKFTVETLDELIKTLQKSKDIKKPPPKVSGKAAPLTGKAKQQQEKNFKDLGGTTYSDQYDEMYGGYEDDYM